MKNQKLTITELADIFNLNNCKENSDNDKRMSKEVSVRRIRDYISKKIVSEGTREGKNKYYNESHLKELSKARELHEEGFSDNEIIKFIQEEKKDKNNKNNIKNLLNDINQRKSNKTNNLGLGIEQIRSNVSLNKISFS